MRKIIFFIFIALLVSACGGENAPAMVEPPADSELPPTIAPTPTTVDDSIFSLNKLNQTPPDDIIREVAFYGGMGGWGGGSACDQGTYKKVEFGPDYSQSSDVEIFTETFTSICAVPVGEQVKVSVELSSGVTHQYQVTSQKTESGSTGEVDFEYAPALDDPIGKQVITFTGSGWQLEKTINVVDAKAPRLYLAENQLIFYKFQPNENVRLFVYKETRAGSKNMPSQELVGWKQYQINSNGKLTLSISVSEGLRFVAIGEISGQVIYQLPSNESGYSFWAMRFTTDYYCPGAPKQIGISPGGYVRVISEQLMMDGELLPKGTILQTDSNPECVDQTWQWKLKCVTGSCWGAVKEAGPDGPYLEPLAALPPTPTFDPANIPACPGAKPTRLKPNMQAKVSKVATQLSLRAQAGMDAAKVHVIASGRLINILGDAPVCVDNAYWWHVYVPEKRFEGWVREGDNKDYWIDPLP